MNEEENKFLDDYSLTFGERGSVERNIISSLLSLHDKKLAEKIKSQNELLRSAYQIAARRGKETNWDAFIIRLEEELAAQVIEGKEGV